MDEFDQLLELENTLLVKGKAEGLEAGKQLGYKDGNVAGYAKGCEIGKEIGFYFGNAYVWSKLLDKYPDMFSERYGTIHTTIMHKSQPTPRALGCIKGALN